MAQSRSRDNIENVRQLRVGAHVLNKSYVKGDIVTLGNNMYVAIQLTSVTPPSATDWKIMDRGGLIWNNYTQYQSGDIVSYNGDIYVVGATPPAAGTPPTDPAFSDIGPITPERGGLIWNPTVQYYEGDIVSINGDIYVIGATPPAVGTPPTSSLNDRVVFSEAGAGNSAGSDRVSTMISLTQSEYDNITSKQTDCLYIIKG